MLVIPVVRIAVRLVECEMPAVGHHDMQDAVLPVSFFDISAWCVDWTALVCALIDISYIAFYFDAAIIFLSSCECSHNLIGLKVHCMFTMILYLEFY